MGIKDAEKFIHEWGIWERGRLDGIAQAMEMVEILLVHEGCTVEQRDVLLNLYDSLVQAKTR